MQNNFFLNETQPVITFALVFRKRKDLPESEVNVVGSLSFLLSHCTRHGDFTVLEKKVVVSSLVSLHLVFIAKNNQNARK
jgi:hypothetical protein